MAEFPSALVAYSGGVDSALVMAVAHEVLGERALACIGVSPSYPLREQRAAIELAEQIGAPYRVVQPNEIENPDYAANPNNRCYFCKSELHDELQALARAEGFAVILDGTNADDVAQEGAFRPGIAAAREHGVRSPLLEAGISKAEVREIALALNLPVWDKPAMACMSSRVPHGTAITRELLAQIEAAEDFLHELGLRQFRVRHHGEVARIEVAAEAFPLILEHREVIHAHFTRIGYTFVSLDLAGFRSGSMNATRQPAALVALDSIDIH
ncbi:MAG: ATP-dependent sacrificial sulfur transferase LarE [Ardenticatenales bacterium]|nr:ATP-dependent sacrificial sulfur transferase LarE [Ardenticatenales bacterium]